MPGRDDYILKPARLEGRRRSESPGHIAATCEAEAAHNMRRQPKYTASQKKTRHSICGRNFVRCKPIFTILSLTDSQENSLRVRPARCCSSMHIGCRRDTTRMGVNATRTSGGGGRRSPLPRKFTNFSSQNGVIRCILGVLFLRFKCPMDCSCMINFIHCVSKKQDTKLLPITSSNVNRFSQFFHW